MVLDKLENCGKYFSLGDRFEKGFKYLLEADLTNLADGRYDIEGDDVFVLINSYETKKPQEKKPEAHRKYADIQYMITGCEKIGYANLEAQKITKEYNEEKDITFYEEISFYIKMDEGKFAIFLPDDIHMPGIVDGDVKTVKKAVVKVKL